MARKPRRDGRLCVYNTVMGSCCSRTATISSAYYPRHRVRITSDATLDACEEVIDIVYGLRPFKSPVVSSPVASACYVGYCDDEAECDDGSVYGTPASHMSTPEQSPVVVSIHD